MNVNTTIFIAQDIWILQHQQNLLLHCVEGNFGDGKIWQMQHINIFGRIKFGKLVKPVHASAHLHTLIIQTNAWSFINVQTKAHSDVHGIYGSLVPLYLQPIWPGSWTQAWSIILHFWNICNSL